MAGRLAMYCGYAIQPRSAAELERLRLAGQECASRIRRVKRRIISARSYHKGVVNTAFGDGHVSAISDNIDPAVWRALGTRNGGEAVTGDY